MCSDAAPKISIIIPAYNAAPTIGRAIRSVLSQSFTDYEIIVVNDGSADETASQALQAFRHAPAATDGRRLRLTGHDSNSGSAAAWQTGLDAARGEYVTKLDADDTLPPDALRRLVEAAAGGAEVVRGQFNRIEGSRRRKAGPRATNVTLNDSPITVDYFSLWGKLIKRSLLTTADMRAFPGLDRWEDLGVVARVMALEPRTVTIAEATYDYRIAPKGSSLSTSSKIRLLNDHIGVARHLDRWMAGKGLSEKHAEFLLHLKFAAKVKFMRGKKKDPSGWKATFPEVNSKVMTLRHVPLIYRLLFSAVSLM